MCEGPRLRWRISSMPHPAQHLPLLLWLPWQAPQQEKSEHRVFIILIQTQMIQRISQLYSHHS